MQFRSYKRESTVRMGELSICDAQCVDNAIRDITNSVQNCTLQTAVITDAREYRTPTRLAPIIMDSRKPQNPQACVTDTASIHGYGDRLLTRLAAKRW